jgi:hypothetical protein
MGDLSSGLFSGKNRQAHSPAMPRVRAANTVYHGKVYQLKAKTSYAMSPDGVPCDIIIPLFKIMKELGHA